MSNKNKRNTRGKNKAKGDHTSGPHPSPSTTDRQTGTGGQNSGSRRTTPPVSATAPTITSPLTGAVPELAKGIFDNMDQELKDVLEDTEPKVGVNSRSEISKTLENVTSKTPKNLSINMNDQPNGLTEAKTRDSFTSRKAIDPTGNRFVRQAKHLSGGLRTSFSSMVSSVTGGRKTKPNHVLPKTPVQNESPFKDPKIDSPKIDPPSDEDGTCEEEKSDTREIPETPKPVQIQKHLCMTPWF